MAERFSPRPEQWSKAEEQVNKAERAARQAAKAGRSAYAETGVPASTRAGKETEELLEKAKRPRVAKKAVEGEREHKAEAEDIMGEANSLERVLAGFRFQNLIRALRSEHRLEAKEKKLIDEEAGILKSFEGEPGSADLAALKEIRAERDVLAKERKELLESNPEAYFGIHLKELKEYKDQLGSGKIVETPYVREQAEDIVAHLQASRPVFIHGELGSGKTELAMHIARKYMGKEALVISGSKYTSLAELYGHQVLAIDKVDKNQVTQYNQEVEEQIKVWEKEHPEAKEQEKALAAERILQIYLATLKGGTKTDFFLGPVYRAMEEGRPVIIDEVNAIPHEVLISLNHILTRKPGEPLNVQQDSGKVVTVKEGFSIMMTGNLNEWQEKYVNRQEMDPAFLSRLYPKEYDYLPQTIEGALEDEAGEENELFQLLLARVMDKNGNVEAPQGSIQELWRLAQAARLTQNVFAGKETDAAFYFKEGGGRGIKYLLKKSVLSIRALDAVIGRWQEEGYKNELDHYLWKEFVATSTVAADRAYLYQVLKDQFGFFKSKDWPQTPDYGTGGNVRSFEVKAPKNPAQPIGFKGPREAVEAAFGKAPERAQWPQLETGEGAPEAEADAEILEALEQFQGRAAEEIEKLTGDLERFCEMPPATEATPPGKPSLKERFFGAKKRK